MAALVSNILTHPVTTFSLSQLDGNKMTGVVARDMLQNRGVISEARNRDPVDGKAMWLTMWATTVIWGFGMPIITALCAGGADRFGQRPFLNMDRSVLTQPGFAEYATQFAQEGQKAGGHLAHLGTKVSQILRHDGKAITTQAAHELYENKQFWAFLAASVVPSLLVGPVLTAYTRHQTYQTLLQEAKERLALQQQHAAAVDHPTQPPHSTFQGVHGATETPTLLASAPSATNGWGAQPPSPSPFMVSAAMPPALLLSLAATQPKSLLQQSNSVAAAPHLPEQTNRRLAAETSPTLRSPAPSQSPFGSLPAGSGVSKLAEAATVTAAAGGVLAGAKGWANQLVHNLMQNPVLANLLGVDAAISLGRVIGNKNHVEWLIQEGAFVGMVYFGGPWFNDKIRDGIGQLNPTIKPFLEFEFDGLRHLSEKYLQKASQSGEGDLTPGKRFANDFEHAAKELGLSLEGDDTQFAQHLLEKSEHVVAQLQQRLLPGQYEAGKNVIVDMLVQNGTVPTFKQSLGEAWQEQGVGALFNRKPVAYNLTQGIPQADALETTKLGFGKEIAHALWGQHQKTTGVLDNGQTVEGVILRMRKLAQHAATEQGEQQLKTLVSHVTMGKAGALAASYGISYLLLAHLSPKLQHWISAKQTGETQRAPYIVEMQKKIEQKLEAPGLFSRSTTLAAGVQPSASAALINQVQTPYQPPFLKQLQPNAFASA